MRSDAAYEPYVAANDGAATDGDAAQHSRARINNDIVFHDRMTRFALQQCTGLVCRKPLGAQRDGLVQAHALADDGSLADDNTGAVVDEEVTGDLRAGMNVDPRR